MIRNARTMALCALLSLPLVACGNSQADAPADAGDPPPSPIAGPRVPLAPTADDALPAALLGQAGPLQGEGLSYVAGDTQTTGYLAVPAGAGPFPALVIVHEWNGLVDRVREVADDFAAEGYVTLAVDLYDGRTGSNPDENIALMREVGADQPKMINNMNAAVGYLRGRPDVTGRVGTMGWCFGGGIALSFGLDGENHEATAIFYGRLVDDPEVLATMDHEVYGTFARLDQGPAPEQVQAFQAALEAAGIQNDLHIYDDVNHGFWLHADQEPEVRNGPALDAWQRLKAYLERTLG